MSFGLKHNIPDRALPDALRTLLIQQVKSLEALLQYTQDTANAISANNDSTAHEKRLATLTDEVNHRLTELEHKNIEIERQICEFQALLSQQGNPILGYTLERFREVMAGNFVMARERIDEMLSQR